VNLIDILRLAVVALRKLGPYALLELVMPGGTILALLLFLYRRRRNSGGGSAQSPVARPAVRSSYEEERRTMSSALNVDCGSTVRRYRIAPSNALCPLELA
jgi:hypothetical protein